MNSTETITLTQFVNSKSDSELTFDRFDIHDISMEGDIMMSKNLLHDYIEDMLPLCKTLYLNQSEMLQYKYRPRLLAHRIYGNPNYYFILLLLNNMADEKEFDRNTLQIIPPNNMVNVLSAIYNANANILRLNQNKALDFSREKQSEWV